MLKKNCFKCGKELESVFPDKFQAYAGTQFVSYGHYGSTVFDPMNESEYIEIVICDDCLLKNSDNVSHMTKEVSHSSLNTVGNEEEENIEALEKVSHTTTITYTSTTWNPVIKEGSF